MASSINFALFMVAAILIQGLNGARLRRSNLLEDLLNQAKTQFETTAQELNKLTSNVNLQEITPLIANQTQELRERTESLTSELRRQYETHGSELSEKTSATISDVIGRLSESVSTLQSNVPNATAQAEEFRQNFQNTAQTLIAEIGKVAKATSEDAGAAQTNIETLSRSALTNTVDVFQAIQRQLQQNTQS